MAYGKIKMGKTKPNPRPGGDPRKPKPGFGINPPKKKPGYGIMPVPIPGKKPGYGIMPVPIPGKKKPMPPVRPGGPIVDPKNESPRGGRRVIQKDTQKKRQTVTRNSGGR